MVSIIATVKIKKCQICNINDHLVDFEHHLRKNIFNEHYLKGYHQKLVPNLNGLFHDYKNFLCFLAAIGILGRHGVYSCQKV